MTVRGIQIGCVRFKLCGTGIDAFVRHRSRGMLQPRLTHLVRSDSKQETDPIVRKSQLLGVPQQPIGHGNCGSVGMIQERSLKVDHLPHLR